MAAAGPRRRRRWLWVKLPLTAALSAAGVRLLWPGAMLLLEGCRPGRAGDAAMSGIAGLVFLALGWAASGGRWRALATFALAVEIGAAATCLSNLAVLTVCR